MYQLLLSALMVASFAWLSEAKDIPHLVTPDVGVSDDFLVSLGTGAESYLIKRLHDPRNERYYVGLVVRLATLGGKHELNNIRLRALKDFVEAQSRRDEKVDYQVISAMYRAMEVIGSLGGEGGVKYLTDWLMSDEQIRAVKCQHQKQGTEFVRFRLQHAAVIGLGLSGNAKGLEVLRSLEKTPPEVKDKRKFRSAIEQAIRNNVEMHEKSLQMPHEDPG